MAHRLQSVLVGIAFLALLAAPVIGFSHAVVSHTHTHAADNALHSVIEHGIEQVLARKEVLVPAALIPVLLMLVMQNMSRPVVVGQTHTRLHITSLRRGILPYRRFD